MALPEVLISEEEIARRVREIAKQIDTDMADAGEVLLVGVLRGSFIFLADLARALTVPRTLDFIAVSSYESGASFAGEVRLIMDVRTAVAGKHVIIVEDIVDSGRTLAYLLEVFSARHPASVSTCALVRKPNQSTHVEVEYVGFDIPDEWVVGYGLDYNNRHRGLPYIGIIDPED
jgi:hypoxanthine phosphoribosyltransferase